MSFQIFVGDLCWLLIILIEEKQMGDFAEGTTPKYYTEYRKLQTGLF
jgi:hypothetical protein